MADAYVILNDLRFGELIVSTSNYVENSPVLFCLPILFDVRPNNKKYRLQF